MHNEKARFDLAIFVTDIDNRLHVSWIYKTDLFETSTIARMAKEFETLLKNVVSEPETRLNSLELRTEEELARQAQAEQRKLDSLVAGPTSRRRASVKLPQISVTKTSSIAPGQELPLVIQPVADEVDLVDWATGNRDDLVSKLTTCGAVLLRGFDVPSRDDFARLVSVFTDDRHTDWGSAGQDAIAALYDVDSTDTRVVFQNDGGHARHWPLRKWLYCTNSTEADGEIHLADGRQVYQTLSHDISGRLEKLGLRYARDFANGDWQEFFGTSDRSVVEDSCRQGDIQLEWSAAGELRTVKDGLAIARHPHTNEKVFFGQLPLQVLSSTTKPSSRKPTSTITFGDGSPLDEATLNAVQEAYQKVGVKFSWRKGDILMFDNMLIATAQPRAPASQFLAAATADVVDGGHCQAELDTALRGARKDV